MAVVIRMPKMSDTMTEGVIVGWNYQVGDDINPGDMIADVETDKATMELENYDKGTLLYIAANEGDAVPIDGVVAVVGKKGEDYEALLAESAAPAVAEAKDEQSEPEVKTESVPTVAPTVQSSGDDRIKASPLAKKLASDKGISLSAVSGTGENGRIVKRDVENYQPAAGVSTTVSGVESFEELPVSQMRKTIASRLSESKFTAPHFYLTMEIAMDTVVEARSQINEYSEVKISMNDIIVKAAATALRKNPKINSSWLGDKIRINHHIHIGVAMAVDEGLLVPVVRFADNKSLSQISSEVKEYSGKAKEKKLQPQDWEGNTFTISNLGMFGIEEFTAIVNPPDACIMAIGGVKDTVGVVNGEVKPVKTMKVTLSCDHRVVDGVVGSKFLQTFKELMEEPVKILV
jgi:pyruvate dehydrogenase E2 component (dihydrolipoamide acetyltransferase)